MIEFSQDYLTYIKSPRWKAKCDAYWYKYGRKCRACGARQNLHVHHMSYDNFKKEPLTDLAGLCYSCHNEVHKRHRRNRRYSLRLVTLSYIKERSSSSKK